MYICTKNWWLFRLKIERELYYNIEVKYYCKEVIDSKNIGCYTFHIKLYLIQAKNSKLRMVSYN